MPRRFRDEKELDKNKRITEYDKLKRRERGVDDSEDEIKVYGSDDNMDAPVDGEGQDVDAPLNDDEYDDVPLDNDGIDDFEDDDIGEIDGDDDFDEEPESDIELAQQFIDLIRKIADNSSDDEFETDFDDESLREAFGKLFINEEVDYTFQRTMVEFAEKGVNAVEPSDVNEIVTSLKESQASKGVEFDYNQIDTDDYYHIVKLAFENKNVYTVLNRVDESELDSVKANTAQSNSNWKSTVARFLEGYGDEGLEDNEKIREERKYWKNLTRKEGVVSGNKIMEFVAKASNDEFTYVFVSDNAILGESLVSNKKKGLKEDAKTLSNKTRKTTAGDTDSWVMDINKVLPKMIATIFKGEVKPFSDVAAEFKKVNQPSGAKGQSPKRRGDKRNSDPMRSLKAEATVAVMSAINEMSEGEIFALITALSKKVKPSDIVEAAKLNMDSDLNALTEASEGNNLSEEFLKDTKLIFESAITDRLAHAGKGLNVAYALRTKEKARQIQEKMAGNLETYLDYVADSYFEENKVAIEEGLKVELTENLLEDFFNVLKSHNINVPDGATTVVEEKEKELVRLKEEKERADKRAMALKEKAIKFMKEAINSRHKVGLTIKEANELDRRTAGIKFSSEKEYEEKVEDIRRLYFDRKRKVTNEDKAASIDVGDIEDGTLMESLEDNTNSNGRMDRYVKIIELQNKNNQI